MEARIAFPQKLMIKKMAIDGVKIIDGDIAHDTYWGIMDLYDEGSALEVIHKEFPIVLKDYYDDFNNEVYVTSCALALWEIGQMTEDKLAFVKLIIDKGACVEVWNEYNKKEGKARQKQLDKLWKKISQPNSKIRARKNYKNVSRFCFQPDDVLAFQLNDGSYRTIICVSINQYRGKCSYILALTTYSSIKKPSIMDIKEGEILGIQIGIGSKEHALRQQPGIDKIWRLLGGDCNFILGLVIVSVDHKDLTKFKDRFERIGSIQMLEGFKVGGSFQHALSFEDLEAAINYVDKDTRKSIGKYPMSLMM